MNAILEIAALLLIVGVLVWLGVWLKGMGWALTIFESKRTFVKAALFIIPFMLCFLAYVRATSIAGVHLIGYVAMGIAFGLMASVAFAQKGDYQGFGIAFFSAFLAYLSMVTLDTLSSFGLAAHSVNWISFGISVRLKTYQCSSGIVVGFLIYGFLVSLLSLLFGTIGAGGHVLGNAMRSLAASRRQRTHHSPPQIKAAWIGVVGVVSAAVLAGIVAIIVAVLGG